MPLLRGGTKQYATVTQTGTFARIEVSYSANVTYSGTACRWPGSNIFIF